MTGSSTVPASSPRRAQAGQALVLGSLDFKRFAFVTAVGGASGLVIPSLGPLREPLLILVFFALCAMLFMAVLRRQFTLAWSLTAFMCAIEPAFRAHAPVLPYLSLDYVFLATGVVTFFRSRPRRGAPSLPVVAYGIYIALEIAGSVSAENWSEARAIVLPSLVMFMFLLNSGRTRMSPSGTTFVLASYIAGAVTLTGFALRSYLSGHITWGTESNLEASGGMPPNHISVLLSVAVFASVVISEGGKRIQRILILGTATVLGALMVLTFSRGGTVLLLGALLFYYIVLRPTSRRTVLALVAIAVMGLIISYGTREITGGKISDRYSQINTSNRFTIVVQGWGIYVDHPVLGVGTSNFREAISQTEFARVAGAHNELIRAAAEHGTLGLLTWLVFIGSTFFATLRVKEVHRTRRGLRLVIFLFAMTSMFYNGLKLTVQPMLFLVALSAFTVAESEPNPSSPRRRTAFTRGA